MKNDDLKQLSLYYLKKLCKEISDRSVGTEGNIEATDFFEKELSSLGWNTKTQGFDAIDWEYGSASLQIDNLKFEVFVSPYSLGCDIEETLICISTIQRLEQSDIKDKIVLLYGEIAKEQLMPKNFVFYNPEHHQQIISLLEKGTPKAIVCATGRNASLAGGVYPFPLIEDGDFDIPSVYMTEDEGQKLLPLAGKTVVLKSMSTRIPSKGCNVIARKGKETNERIVITAHIDSKKGSPGAIDNATGVVVLLILANILKDYDGNKLIEIAAFNGEDYYAASGQMVYIKENQKRFNEIILNINIDGAGYKEGKSAFSFYDLPKEIEDNVKIVLNKFDGLTEGVQWPQGDHSIFIQNGCPAIAVSSKWFIDNIASQDITHTEKDNIGIVDSDKLVEIALALELIIDKYNS